MARRKRSARSSKDSNDPSATSAARDPEIARLTRFLDLMRQHGLTELEIGPDGHAVRISKSGSAPVALPYAAPFAAPIANVPGSAPAAPAPSNAAPAKELANGEPFLSPMVGTFYRAASPEAKAFVMEGDVIKPESVLCIIEAMKVMNEVKAERAGKVVQILVENGEAVEYGQPLFVIQRTG